MAFSASSTATSAFLISAVSGIAASAITSNDNKVTALLFSASIIPSFAAAITFFAALKSASTLSIAFIFRSALSFNAANCASNSLHFVLSSFVASSSQAETIALLASLSAIVAFEIRAVSGVGISSDDNCLISA